MCTPVLIYPNENMKNKNQGDPLHTCIWNQNTWNLTVAIFIWIELHCEIWTLVLTPVQTWDLSKNLHDQIFGPNFLLTKSA